MFLKTYVLLRASWEFMAMLKRAPLLCKLVHPLSFLEDRKCENEGRMNLSYLFKAVLHSDALTSKIVSRWLVRDHESVRDEQHLHSLHPLSPSLFVSL